MNNRASYCWRIMPVTVEQSYQPLLNNHASNCWRIVQTTWAILPAIVAHNFELLNNRASDCWRITPAIVEELCQWLLKNHASDCWKNCASDCWWIVPTAVEQSCQLFFSLILTYFGKILTSFSCKYLHYYWLFQFRVTTE